MALYSARELTHSFGGPRLFDRAQFVLESQERVCLIGRNGEGKTTLMKILAGMLSPDAGEFERSPGLRISYLGQDVPDSLPGKVWDVVSEGAGEWIHLERAYHETMHGLDQAEADVDAILARMSELQTQLESTGGWRMAQRVEEILTRLKLDADAPFDALSGGMKRRVLLGRALVADPGLLLLDEPTNHLDFDSIAWLEEFLPSLKAAILFVTHDRAFLRRMATRILELDRGQLVSFDCNYDSYLERKTAMLEAEQSRNAAFDKKLASEEVWIRRGIKARRTRNEGRVRELKKLREERSRRRDVREGPAFGIQEGDLSGRKVIVAKDLSYKWEDSPIVRGFSSVIWRGDKIGVIGPNGSGKTTLLRLLLGDLKPDQGSVEYGTNLKVAYFDQHREQLDGEQTLIEAVAGDNDHVIAGGQKRHVYSYLEDFMFDGLQARSRVSSLSGGEKNRLLLARLFTREANLLVMDEPTNDLDVETLELLEDLLFEFSGTLLLVSHDREFLNRIATQTFALEGDGRVTETVGGYDEYFRDRRLAQEVFARKQREPNRTGDQPMRGTGTLKPRSRTRKEQAELDAIPAKIEALELSQASYLSEMSKVGFGADSRRREEVHQALDAIEKDLQVLYGRWESLESIPVQGS